MRTTTILLAVCASAPVASAGVAHGPAPADLFATRAPGQAFDLVRRRLPASGPVSALAQSKIIYLNHTGITLTPGDDDSRTNRSSIVPGQVSVPAWNTSAATWAATVTCMKDMFSRFDVTVTDVNPGSTPHMEAVFGGSPQNIGMGSGVGGVSPFTDDCAVIENSIVFTFTNVFPNDAQVVCEVMAQEVAHSYGLDHEMLASDPMTYLNYNGDRTFKDQTVACGEYQNRPCGIGGSTCRANQNSVQLLSQRLGVADRIAPELQIIEPADNAVVPPGFAVTALATDNVAVTMASLAIDGEPAGGQPGSGPFTFATDAALAEGVHTLTVEATDGKNPRTQTITITVATPVPPGDPNEDDATGGSDGGLAGGCATGHGPGLGLGLAAMALLRRRRANRARGRERAN
jgi:hypothetical protein